MHPLLVWRGAFVALLFCLIPAVAQEKAPIAGNPVAANAPVPPASPAEVPAPKVPALPPRGTLTIEGNAQKLSVFAIGVDAPELLTAIAAKAGLKLVVDDTVSRRITISVKDQSAREVI